MIRFFWASLLIFTAADLVGVALVANEPNSVAIFLLAQYMSVLED